MDRAAGIEAPAAGVTALDEHPLVLAAHRLARDMLIPGAERVDAEGVRPLALDAIAAAGLLGATAPVGAGGGGAPPPVGRAVAEILAGADGSTWFVAAQHATPLATVLRSGNPAIRDRWSRPLATGTTLAGVAFSHLRRPGPPQVVGTRVPGGWRISGRVDWYTGWGLNSVLLLSARTGAAAGEDLAVHALVRARDQPGLHASAPLQLAAMAATRTVRLDLDLTVQDTDVAVVEPYADWRAADAAASVNVVPAVFGLLDRITTVLAEAGTRSGEPAPAALARALSREGRRLRSRAYALVDGAAAQDRIEERLRLRAAALELLNRAAAAAVVAGSGRSMSTASPAQRLAREALFYLVQAQTPAVRAATLARYAERSG